MKWRLHRCNSVLQSSAAIGLILVMGIIGIQGIFGDNIINSSVSANSDSLNEDYTITNNIDTVLLLQETEWEQLTTQNKLNILQIIANIEADYLGLPNKLNLGAANLEEHTAACYNDKTQTISIDLNHLENDSVYDVLNSCCHEVYHSYQYRLVDAYLAAEDDVKRLHIYDTATEYAQEFSNYIDNNMDFCQYYYQNCEKDAREYAENAVHRYYIFISEYIVENE